MSLPEFHDTDIELQYLDDCWAVYDDSLPTRRSVPPTTVEGRETCWEVYVNRKWHRVFATCRSENRRDYVILDDGEHLFLIERL